MHRIADSLWRAEIGLRAVLLSLLLTCVAPSATRGQSVLIDESFSNNILPPGWTHFDGSLTFTDGTMALDSGCVILPGQFSRSGNIRIEADVNITWQGAGDFNFYVFFDPFSAPTCRGVTPNGYDFASYPLGSDNTVDIIGVFLDGVGEHLATRPTHLTHNEWHRIAAELHSDGTLKLEHNGEKILRAINFDHQEGPIVLRSWGRVHIDNVRVLGSRPGDCSTSGTTVITHGFQRDGELPETHWMRPMAQGIAEQVEPNCGTVHNYDRYTGQLIPEPSGTGGERIILFDWAEESNDSGKGWSEAAADALFATLMMYRDRLDLGHLHLIGHSRGSVVNSEVAERLLTIGGMAMIEQVTTLDPHDTGILGKDFRWGDSDVNAKHEDEYGKESGIWTWTGVNYADNYYQLKGFGLRGRFVYGAANLEFPEVRNGFFISHTEIPHWYGLTVSETYPIPPQQGWFHETETQCTYDPDFLGDEIQRRHVLRRDREGFYFSRLGGGEQGRCPEDDQIGKKLVPLFDFCREGIVNGDFKRGEAGWRHHGGHGDGVIERNRLTLCDSKDSLFTCAGNGSARTHNRFYVPEEATTISYRRKIEGGRPSRRASGALGKLAFKFMDTSGALASAPFIDILAAGERGFVTSLIALPDELTDRVLTLQIEVEADPGRSIVLQVDDIQLGELCSED